MSTIRSTKLPAHIRSSLAHIENKKIIEECILTHDWETWLRNMIENHDRETWLRNMIEIHDWNKLLGNMIDKENWICDTWLVSNRNFSLLGSPPSSSIVSGCLQEDGCGSNLLISVQRAVIASVSIITSGSTNLTDILAQNRASKNLSDRIS